LIRRTVGISLARIIYRGLVFFPEFKMSKRNTAVLFWDVDTQIDFLTPGGKLYVPGAERIIRNLRLLTSWAGNHKIPIVSSACAHFPGDPELNTYGPHCMIGTPGQKKIPETLLPNGLTVPNRLIALPELHSFQQIVIEKQHFDVFTNPNSDAILQQFGEGLRIVMYGAATDICVAHAANALLDRGYAVELVEDAIAALDLQKEKSVLQKFMDRGGRLVSLNELVKIGPAV
jgi:nicotinamidase/pyrazinamidase